MYHWKSLAHALIAIASDNNLTIASIIGHLVGHWSMAGITIPTVSHVGNNFLEELVRDSRLIALSFIQITTNAVWITFK